MKYRVNGRFIEIYFDSVPSEKLRETMKICGWHWYGKNKCWSNFYSSENMEWVKTLEKELKPKEENPLLNLPKEKIEMTDLLVRSNSFYCNRNHHLEDMAGEIEVVDKFNNIHTYLVPIVYCKECDVYYILEETYRSLKQNGRRIRAEILTYKAYYESDREDWELREMSPLKAWGYNVSEKDGYTDVQRQSILEDIIDCGVLTKHEVLSYLDFFIRLNESKCNMSLGKWKDDREYVAQYHMGTAKRKKIGNVIVTNYYSK